MDGMNQDFSDTAPVKPKSDDTRPVKTRQTSTSAERKRYAQPLLWAIIISLFLGFAVAVGALAGFQSGTRVRQAEKSNQSFISIQEQYDLGVQDLEAGNYELAIQRFEYVLSQDPNFPGIMDQMAIAMQVLYSTATPLPKVSASSVTPTRDPRPVEELLNQALNLVINQDWSNGIETLIALRKENPNFQVAQVDGLLYLALRYRGVNKILNEGNFEGGIYDLTLADKFGPLDGEADSAREWARLYTIGMGFWEVHPEQAVYYFSQVASAAPYLRDASGWTANDRYRAALIQFGSILARKGNWCGAQTQYELALAIRADESLQGLATQASINCAGITPTLSTGTMTETATPSTTVFLPTIVTPTYTQGIPSSPTPSQTEAPLATTELPTATQAPATTEAPPPSNTPEPPQTTTVPSKPTSGDT